MLRFGESLSNSVVINASVTLTLTAQAPSEDPEVVPQELGILEHKVDLPILEVPVGDSAAVFEVLQAKFGQLCLSGADFLGITRPPKKPLRLTSVAAGGRRHIPPKNEHMTKLEDLGSVQFPHRIDTVAVIDGKSRQVTIFGRFNAAEIDVSKYTASIVMHGGLPTTLYTPTE
jgi:hypothetical protein